MLFSTLIPITLLAASAAAYPASDSSGQHLPSVPAPVTATPTSKVCQRTCFAGPTECQAGWVSEQIGGCWACCEAEADGDSGEDPYPMPSPVPDEPSAPKICQKMCFGEPTECQAGWVSEQIGGCWACCEADGSEDPYPMPSPVPDGPATENKVCERMCNDGPSECQAGWVSEQIGECWACCEA